eukprot:CAMPEP_0206302834 /NCGR_PEP_ID=MMETSP0106_2-20121207/8925_1 /ASSEMBLY_ACC=CAM_ASM_000206 /TAXON_ID=81532 /ORGANISM="Acanthoeca-like sp., Strain 10tr" /LENGTH=287 /DNA_ID=CAMNT_0053733609 /DNA_START=253 /DNA_END=1117 /DNA_ORIENTATION=+
MSGADVRQFLHEDELASLYGWLDEIPLSRPKRNITRDFADGVMAAEVIAHFLPRNIETHNYQPCAGRKQKRGNWDTLNKKVLRRVLNFLIPDNVIDAIIAMRPGVVEVVLVHMRKNIEAHLARAKNRGGGGAYDARQREMMMQEMAAGGMGSIPMPHVQQSQMQPGTGMAQGGGGVGQGRDGSMMRPRDPSMIKASAGPAASSPRRGGAAVAAATADVRSPRQGGDGRSVGRQKLTPKSTRRRGRAGDAVTLDDPAAAPGPDVALTGWGPAAARSFRQSRDPRWQTP